MFYVQINARARLPRISGPKGKKTLKVEAPEKKGGGGSLFLKEGGGGRTRFPRTRRRRQKQPIPPLRSPFRYLGLFSHQQSAAEACSGAKRRGGRFLSSYDGGGGGSARGKERGRAGKSGSD